METGDLLLLVALIVLGLLGLAYVVFVLGDRAGKQYVLSCPPCAAGGSSTTAAPVQASRPPPPGFIVTPPTAISTMPAVPPVMTGPSKPLAPTVIPIPTGSTLLFRNRANDRYLSVCNGCSSSASLVVMAHESNFNASYAQWAPTANGNGWLLASKFNTSAGVLQALPNSSIYAIKQNDAGVASTVTFHPADSQGYHLVVDGSVLQTCCPAQQTPKCACPQFKESAPYGVTSAAVVPNDPRQIWDVYLLQANRTIIPLLELSPAQRFMARRQ